MGKTEEERGRGEWDPKGPEAETWVWQCPGCGQNTGTPRSAQVALPTGHPLWAPSLTLAASLGDHAHPGERTARGWSFEFSRSSGSSFLPQNEQAGWTGTAPEETKRGQSSPGNEAIIPEGPLLEGKEGLKLSHSQHQNSTGPSRAQYRCAKWTRVVPQALPRLCHPGS